MDGAVHPDVHALRKRRWRHSPGGDVRAERTPDRIEGTGRWIVCARCDAEISQDGDKIEKNGLFEHSQVNPHGYIWRFGCFSRAPGVVPTGPRERHFSWFPGMTWRLVHCASCALHLGWLFEGESERFFGLILDRLAEGQRGGDL